MNLDLLFDTHSFIWWADEPIKLSATACAALEDENNRLVLSDVSIWEIQIKVQLGKMKLKLPLLDLIESQKRDNEVEILPIKTEHILALDGFPFHHKDPFDRLLIAQSKVENLTIVTLDPGVSALWCKTVVVKAQPNGGVILMHRTEQMYCLIDRGRIESIGRFVTGAGEVIEIGCCRFDGAISGFRWTEDSGWEAVFLRDYDEARGSGIIRFIERADGTQPYTEADIAVGLERALEKWRSTGPG